MFWTGMKHVLNERHFQNEKIMDEPFSNELKHETMSPCFKMIEPCYVHVFKNVPQVLCLFAQFGVYTYSQKMDQKIRLEPLFTEEISNATSTSWESDRDIPTQNPNPMEGEVFSDGRFRAAL